MKKVFIESGGSDYRRMFQKNGFATTDDYKAADLICFTGGEDVHPSFYGHSKHPQTYASIERDVMCMHLYRAALALAIPMVGICRGGQFLNVANGGWMYQHVVGHTRPHMLELPVPGLGSVMASSTHHQMMAPASNGRLLGYGEEGTCKSLEYWDLKKGWVREERGDINNEVVLYDDTRSLCFQPHPEFEEYSDLRNAFFGLLDIYLMI